MISAVQAYRGLDGGIINKLYSGNNVEGNNRDFVQFTVS
jgi:hypothetical protein